MHARPITCPRPSGRRSRAYALCTRGCGSPTPAARSRVASVSQEAASQATQPCCQDHSALSSNLATTTTVGGVGGTGRGGGDKQGTFARFARFARFFQRKGVERSPKIFFFLGRKKKNLPDRPGALGRKMVRKPCNPCKPLAALRGCASPTRPRPTASATCTPDGYGASARSVAVAPAPGEPT